jgi:PAS domain S-box-containing protein
MDVSWRMVREDGSPFPRNALPAMRTLRTGQPMSHVVVGLEKPDGELTWISLNTYPLRNPDERAPHAVVSSFTDITERKHAEDALREVTERFRIAFDTSRSTGP